VVLKTQLILSLIALAAMTSYAKNPKAVIESYDTQKFLREKTRYEPNIGKDYWVEVPVFLCKRPAYDPEGECELVGVITKLQPDGIEQGTFGAPYYHVRLADGRTGYVDAFSFVSNTTAIDLEKAAAECKRRGGPRVGMSAKQVVATCWGEPSHVDRRETARGISAVRLQQGRICYSSQWNRDRG
jgi:hypothetical protein